MASPIDTGGGSFEGSSSAGSNGTFADNAPVMVAPVATNLGAILQPFMGPPENGGQGISPRSRLVESFTDNFFSMGNKDNTPLYVVGGVVILGIAALLLKRR